jgi:hypothetical protein
VANVVEGGDSRAEWLTRFLYNRKHEVENVPCSEKDGLNCSIKQTLKSASKSKTKSVYSLLGGASMSARNRTAVVLPKSFGNIVAASLRSGRESVRAWCVI